MLFPMMRDLKVRLDFNTPAIDSASTGEMKHRSISKLNRFGQAPWITLANAPKESRMIEKVSVPAKEYCGLMHQLCGPKAWSSGRGTFSGSRELERLS
jgi:hypothetical protein